MGLDTEASARPGNAAVDAYHDRTCAPAETWARVFPHAHDLGITRVGAVTGLDRIGIPVWFAARPNGFSLSVNQGKGIDVISAKVSALMEGAEYAMAARVPAAAVRATRAALEAQGHRPVDLSALLRCDPSAIDFSQPLTWLPGWTLRPESSTGTGDPPVPPVWVPFELVGLDRRRDAGWQTAGFQMATDGLASGNTVVDATLHGLLELIEHDAGAIWAVTGSTLAAGRAIPLGRLSDPVLRDLAERIGRAGLDLALFDMTADIAVPCVVAYIGEPDANGDYPPTAVQFSAGGGCHPNLERAAIRAITEAAQTRLTIIASARDDWTPARYLPKKMAAIPPLMAAAASATALPRSYPDFAPSDVETTLHWVLERLAQSGLGTVTVVPLGGTEYGFEVVHVLAERLEVGMGRGDSRVGPRLLGAYLGGAAL